MSATLRVLILEDQPTDVELMVHELKHAGFRLDWRAAASERDYRRALDATLTEGAFDVILADYSLPGYDALAALAELERRHIPTPFLVVTGMLSDEEAVACMKRGATDYLLKDRLKRIGPAVSRALTEAREARERDRIAEELRQARKAAMEALRQANAMLEIRVAERTRELTEANRRLHAEIIERHRMQDALQQAHKFQAIGRMAAGVAHHFNNLLAVVIGSIEQAGHHVAHEAARMGLAAALQAAERGAGLTRQLLSYSRQQMLRPKVVEPSKHLLDVCRMVAAAMPRTIRVNITVPDELWPVEVDVAELELAIFNLAFNAREAMVEGGTLSLSAINGAIEDARLDLAGRYVIVTIGDTGSGIAQDIIARIFDPFFTTKPIGDGSGLGLSQVHGFTHQAGGSVDIESTPGSGTIVRLFLPAAKDMREVSAASPPPNARAAAMDRAPLDEADHPPAGLKATPIPR